MSQTATSFPENDSLSIRISIHKINKLQDKPVPEGAACLAHTVSFHHANNLQCSQMPTDVNGVKEDKHILPSTNMTKLGAIDVEVISLGIGKKGMFDEHDIARSDLKRLGVGRIMDLLASLKDRRLIDQNKDGSFSVTDLARDALYDDKTDIKVRILRLLEEKPNSIEEISKALGKRHEEVLEKIEELRRDRLVLMSPLRVDEKLLKYYEILPGSLESIRTIHETADPSKEPTHNKILGIVDEIARDVESGVAGKDTIKKINRLKRELELL